MFRDGVLGHVPSTGNDGLLKNALVLIPATTNINYANMSNDSALSLAIETKSYKIRLSRRFWTQAQGGPK